MDICLVVKVSLLEGNGSISMNFINNIGSRGLGLQLILVKVRYKCLLTRLPIEVVTPGILVEKIV